MAGLPALPFIGGVQADLRRGSQFLRTLSANEDPSSYELYSYVRLGDALVGTANASPPGRQAWWVPTPPLEDAHLTAFRDPRIVADIARRLRGEEPFATDPPQPLPGRRAASES